MVTALLLSVPSLLPLRPKGTITSSLPLIFHVRFPSSFYFLPFFRCQRPVVTVPPLVASLSVLSASIQTLP